MARRQTRSNLNTTAESIGQALGRVASKLDRWKRERTEIAAEIQRLMQSAQSMLGDLGDTAERGFKGVTSRKGGRPKGYKMSEATKRKLRAAWKRRKAAMAAAKSAKSAATKS